MAPVGNAGLLNPVKSPWQESAVGDSPPEDLPAILDSLQNQESSGEQEDNKRETPMSGESEALAQDPRPGGPAASGASPNSAAGDAKQQRQLGGNAPTIPAIGDAQKAQLEQDSGEPEGESSGRGDAPSAELGSTESVNASASSDPRGDARGAIPSKESAEQSIPEVGQRDHEGIQSFNKHAGEPRNDSSVKGEHMGTSPLKHSSGSETNEPRQIQPSESTHEAEPPSASGSSKETVSKNLHSHDDPSRRDLSIDSDRSVTAIEDPTAGQQSSGHLQNRSQTGLKDDEETRFNSNVDSQLQFKVYDLAAFNDSDSERGEEDLELSQDTKNESSSAFSHKQAGSPAELSQMDLDRPQQSAAVRNSSGACKSLPIPTSESASATSLDENLEAGAVQEDSLDLEDQHRTLDNEELQPKAAHNRDFPQATETLDGSKLDAARSDSGLGSEPSPASSGQSLQDLAPAPLHAEGEWFLTGCLTTPA